MMASQDNAAMAQNLYARFSEGDLESALAHATEDIEVELVPFGQTFRGHQGFNDFMGSFKQAFPDLTVTVVNQVATDDQVVNECKWTGTHTGPLVTPADEIPPTGKRVEQGRFCEVWRIKNGKVATIHNYQDLASWLRELGLVT